MYLVFSSTSWEVLYDTKIYTIQGKLHSEFDSDPNDRIWAYVSLTRKNVYYMIEIFESVGAKRRAQPDGSMIACKYKSENLSYLKT